MVRRSNDMWTVTLLLPIDQKKRHRPHIMGAAHNTLDKDIRLFLRFRLPGCNRSFFQRNHLWLAPSLLAPPYPPGSTLRRLYNLALFALVVPPARSNEQARPAFVHIEANTNRAATYLFHLG